MRTVNYNSKCRVCGELIAQKTEKCPACGCPVITSAKNIAQYKKLRNSLDKEETHQNHSEINNTKKYPFCIFISLILISIYAWMIFEANISKGHLANVLFLLWLSLPLSVLGVISAIRHTPHSNKLIQVFIFASGIISFATLILFTNFILLPLLT